MPYKPTERVYRAMAVLKAEDVAANAQDRFDVSGYAATFERYRLYQLGNDTIWEEIAPDAFDQADMSDVILQFDHAGRVYARTSNDTLRLDVDSHGLHVQADLSRTPAARELREEIKAGMVNAMSFCFTVEDNQVEEMSQGNYLSRITRIGKVYDVSAVSIPANPGTDIQARSAYDGAIESACAERRSRARQAELLRLKMQLMELEARA